ncbi:exonuclease domain-containing protein [[Pasteurella] aerogenes]
MKGFSALFQRFHPLHQLELARQKWQAQPNLPAELNALFAQPYPQTHADLTALSYLSIDFETTGLNSMMDNILSVAAVPIDHFTLDLSQTWHQFVAEQEIKEDTVVINHIVPQMLNGAETLDEVMNQLFALMKGRVVIAHGANIEKRFIQHYLVTRYNISNFPLLWLDTLKIERSFLKQKSSYLPPDYQLASVRKQYGLPEYITHNALIDAIAAGELFFAQSARLFGKQKMTLGEMYKRAVS